MRAAYKCAFLIVVFCFSTVQNPGLLSDENNLPLHVNARGSYGSDGGFAGGSAIDDLGGTNYAGAVVQFSARVLQGDNYQDASQWIFSSYAISNDGSKYKIQEGKNAVSDKVYFEWDIPTSFPTGLYDICVYIDSIRDDDGWYGYEDYWLGGGDEEDHVYHQNSDTGIDVRTKVCQNTDVEMYRVELITSTDLALPDEVLEVWTNTINPRNGAPITPESSEWEIVYFIDDGDFSYEEVIKSGRLNPSSEGYFSIILPTNLREESNIQVQFWANASGGTQTSYVSSVVRVATLETQINLPTSSQTIYFNEDFILSAKVNRETQYYGSMGENGLQFTALIKQGDAQYTLSFSDSLAQQSLISDDKGEISGLMMMPDNNYPSITLVDGFAELILKYPDGSVAVSKGVFLLERGSESNTGMGVNVDIISPTNLVNVGQEAIFKAKVVDDEGLPIQGAWVYHILEKRGDDYYGSSTRDAGWAYGQTDSQGMLDISVLISQDANPETYTYILMVKAFNVSGASDLESEYVQLNEPTVSLFPMAPYWQENVPVKFKVVSSGLSDAVVNWQADTNLFEFEGTTALPKNGEAEFTITIPSGEDVSRLDVSIIVIDSNGNILTENSRLYHEPSYEIDLWTNEERIVAGEVIELNYKIIQNKATQAIQWPVILELKFVGGTSYSETNLVFEKEGMLAFQLPSDLETGTYLIELDIEDFGEDIMFIEVISQEDDSGISGSVSSFSHSMQDISPIISLSSLVLVSICLIMLIRGRKKEDLGDPWDLPVGKNKPTNQQPPQSNPPPMNSLPGAMNLPQPPPIPQNQYDPSPQFGYQPPPPY